MKYTVVGTARWNANARLTAFYNVLSVNKDRNGKEFVSTIEAKKYPIYGSQWHPGMSVLFLLTRYIGYACRKTNVWMETCWN